MNTSPIYALFDSLGLPKPPIDGEFTIRVNLGLGHVKVLTKSRMSTEVFFIVDDKGSVAVYSPTHLPKKTRDQRIALLLEDGTRTSEIAELLGTTIYVVNNVHKLLTKRATPCSQ